MLLKNTVVEKQPVLLERSAMPYSASTRIFPVNPQAPSADAASTDAITAAADVLRAGGLVAFPTETVYGLGANATDAEAVDRIFSAKGRPASDPIIVHIAQAAQLDAIAIHVPDLAQTLAARFWPGPLTLVLRRGAAIPPNVSAGRDTVAVRMPSHPVARALIQAAGVPVAAPSANTFSRPSATTAAHVLEDLKGRVDIVLDGGPTPIGVESTVLDLTSDMPVVLRPGGVSLEMLRDVIPGITWQARYLNTDENAVSPGQMLKHYSPRAAVLLYDGERSAVLRRMVETAREQVEAGHRVGVLLTDDEIALFDSLPLERLSLGSPRHLQTISARLFAAFRELDQRGVDVILAHGFGHEGLGAAIWDRLVRAAEGRVIEV